MKLRISSEASEDLASVWEYSRDHWGIEQADLYIDGLMLRLIWLTGNKANWRHRTDIKRGVLSCIYKSHVIYFNEGQGSIDILRVLHGRMDSGRHIQ